MLEWLIYVPVSFGRKRPLASGTAHSSGSAGDQARRSVEAHLGLGTIAPGDIIEFVVENNVSYEGPAEGFMGKTALKRMGL